MGVRTIFLIFCLASSAVSVFAIGQQGYVEFSAKTDSFRIVASGTAATIVTDSQDYAGVLRAATDLQADIARVSGAEPKIVSDAAIQGSDVIIIGTLGKSRKIDELVQAGKIDVASIRGHWEAFAIKTVTDPFPGVKRALVIVGSDKRGAIYGIYDLSEQIGVSPWYFWADVPPSKHAQLFVRGGTDVRDEPKVKYRGIFINDEAPCLTGWVKEKYGDYNHQFYARVFELILRMKGNYLWSAMWNSAFSDDDPENPKLADEYGIVMGTSHHEPMMRAQKEWKRYGQGDWNYETNGDFLRSFWAEGVKRNRDHERIITLGMRGDGDKPLSREADTALLEKIVADQRKIIAENVNADVTKVPQLWALYKEVQEYYEKGMRVPDDVTLLWSDDNWGNIRRLPTAEERQRSGGAGVYYHIEYVGAPRSYKWLNTVPISKIWEQMHLAYEYDARQIWIENVGDIKPLEFPAEFFLTYAWNPDRWNAENLDEYARLWATREFGNEHAAEIADIVAKYTKYNYRRKPELLEPTTYSLVNYNEAETVVADYNKIAARAEEIYRLLPQSQKDAFFELVLYPVKACANLNELYMTVGLNRLYAVQGRASTNDLANKARELFRNDEELSRFYNETLAGGKWHHMMDQTHIGYTYWNEPITNAMPAVQEIQVPAKGEMGIAVEGSEASYPGARLEGAPTAKATLPAQNAYDKRSRYFEIFDRGQAPFEFSIENHQPWLIVSQTKGGIPSKDQTIFVSVDWKNVPAGTTKGSITVNGPDGQKVLIDVPIVNTNGSNPQKAGGFVDAGYISIEAEHFDRAIAPTGLEWKTIPDFGRTLSGVTLFPVTTQIPANSARLEYKIYLLKTGPVSLDSYFAPTQKLQPGNGFRYAISFDDGAPQTINFHDGYNQTEWERSVRDGVRVITSKHVLNAGPHVLKFWAVDPDLVLEKLVLNTGGLRPSYLGPPESYRSIGSR
jgi:hypothetical protein